MLDKMFPRSIDNHYHGAKAALWILGILVVLKAAMGVNCIALLLLLGEHVGRKAIFLALPIDTNPALAISINAGFLLLTAAGLVLSVWQRGEPAGAAA